MTKGHVNANKTHQHPPQDEQLILIRAKMCLYIRIAIPHFWIGELETRIHAR